MIRGQIHEEPMERGDAPLPFEALTIVSAERIAQKASPPIFWFVMEIVREDPPARRRLRGLVAFVLRGLVARSADYLGAARGAFEFVAARGKRWRGELAVLLDALSRRVPARKQD